MFGWFYWLFGTSEEKAEVEFAQEQPQEEKAEVEFAQEQPQEEIVEVPVVKKVRTPRKKKEVIVDKTTEVAAPLKKKPGRPKKVKEVVPAQTEQNLPNS